MASKIKKVVELASASALEPCSKLGSGEPQHRSRLVLAVTHFDHVVRSTLLDACSLIAAH